MNLKRPWRQLRSTLRAVRFWLARQAQRVLGLVLGRGMDTGGVISGPEHRHPERVRYEASAWHVLPRALRYLGVSEGDAFVDFGCGKGRVVHQAAKWPFRRVIGVEISPQLAEIARGNLEARRDEHRCRSVEIVVSDAAQFPVPDDVTVGYFYWPFIGATLNTVLTRILDSLDRNPRSFRLIFVCPFNSAQVLETGRFRLLRTQEGILDTVQSRVEIFESC
jgi:SAM-dependent methyltransferase